MFSIACLYTASDRRYAPIVDIRALWVDEPLSIR